MADQEQSRQQFEAAVIVRLGAMFPAGTSADQLRSALLQRGPDGGYADHQRAGEWWAWKASRAQVLQVPSGYVLQDDKFASYLDGQVSRFSISRANGVHLAWISGDGRDDGEAVAHELMRALSAQRIN